jgi:hypothetical protein
VTLDKPLTVRSLNGPAVTEVCGGGNVRCTEMGAGAVLSGLTLRGGGWSGAKCGSGAVVTNCVLRDNAYGGVRGGILYGCWLTNNWDRDGGGASGSTLYNCVLSSNQAIPQMDDWTPSYGRGGGAIWCALYGCTLTGNSAHVGGAVLVSSLQNCVLYGNSATSRADSDESSVTSFSCTTPLSAGVGNISGDPLFVNAAAGDFRLQPGSPCIDAGTDLSAILTNDLAGLPRPLDGNGDGVAAFDMGAYEFNPYRLASPL